MPVVVEDLQQDILSTMTHAHYNDMSYIKDKTPVELLKQYNLKMLRQGNVLCYLDGQKLTAYLEFWRINFEQLGRIVCGEFYADEENINNGPIAYVANVWIDKKYRGTNVGKELKLQFLNTCFTSKYFVGTARRLKSQPLKVMNREQFFGKLKKESNHGRKDND